MALHSNCHLIAVAGAKGGAGKSVLVSNLAASLAKEFKTRVLLCDLDPLTGGDLNLIFGLKPEKTIQDLVNAKTALNPKTISNFVQSHGSGVDVLAAVKDSSESFHVNGEEFLKSLSVISQYYKFILVDLGSKHEDLQYKLMNESSGVIVVTTPDILTINQTKKFLNNMVEQTFPIDLFQICVNKVHRSAMTPKQIQQVLGRPVLGAIPQDDASFYQALSRGAPLVQLAPSGPVARAFVEMSRKLSGGVLSKLKNLGAKKIKTQEKPGSTSSGSINPSQDLSSYKKIKIHIHNELIREMDLKSNLHKTKGDPAKEKELELKTQKSVTGLVDKYVSGVSREDRSQLIKEIVDEALKLGPLEDLLADPNVTEIMVNGADKIFVEKNGKLTLSKTTFTSNQQLRNVIERIVTPLGRRIDEKTPYVDARLQDGSRVNAVIEPLSIDGPAVTIRKFSKDVITAENYLNWGSMNRKMIDFLKLCVDQGLNIVISGGTGSGKTTLLNTMSSFIPMNERIVTVEDAAELQLKQEHVVRLETRPANMEGTGEVSIRDLVRNSLRMRPDRIVVGECRDGAALDMLQAMNTGHDGSMTTVHANSPREAVARLETLCLMAGMELPVKAIREQIAGAVHLFVQIGRLSDGSRKIKSITEVVGMQGDVITLTEVYKFKEEGFDKNRKIIGSFQATGLIPSFVEKFERRGISIPKNLFSNEEELKQVKKVSGIQRSRPRPRPAVEDVEKKKAS